MAGRFNSEPCAAADSGTEGDKQLGEDRDRIGLGVRRDPSGDLAGQLVIDRWVGRGRPSCWRWQELILGAWMCTVGRWWVEE
jgi:hypothetical protein